MTINTSFQSLGGIKQPFPALTLSALGFPLISGYRLVKTIKMATDKACPHVTGLIYCSVSN